MTGPMPTEEIRDRLLIALDRTREYVLTNQRVDGTWTSPVESDPRGTAFYLNTIWNLGRDSDPETREMEIYLSSQQLECGAWPACPGGGPDIDVTAVCMFGLEKAATERGRKARGLAQRWLSGQPLPEVDSFWKGFLALNGELDWAELPYLTPRLVSNPGWVHPNIYDFSFLRIAIVSAGLLQMHSARSLAKRIFVGDKRFQAHEDPAFTEWKRRWVKKAREPKRSLLLFFCYILKKIDSMTAVERHREFAIQWLLKHQEEDGSFFSSVHMTSIAILTLHRLNPISHAKQIQAGVDAMRRWHLSDNGGRRQQFTDSTNWDTFLALDLLRAIGVASAGRHVERARDYVISSQGAHLGDWSHRTPYPSGGGWGFQRIGKWYPDNDDTVMAISALLGLEDDTCADAIQKGVQWLLAMQSSDGGWASWDRNDRSWIRIPGGGPWFARDLACPEITSRVIVLLSRVIRINRPGYDYLIPSARKALLRGMGWLRRNKKNGIWFGRWFTHYLYGTCHALEAYRAVGYADSEPEIRAAQEWLISSANADGGFGEASNSGSGRRKEFVGAASTPFHTACALIGLVHAGASTHPVAQRAVSWLLDNQNIEGSWTNRDFFAAGVPGLWYANFSFTPTYFVAKSLLLFKKAEFS
jgi:squalene-hopene/tetraprenyl-beta-curcumene cyclase